MVSALLVLLSHTREAEVLEKANNQIPVYNRAERKLICLKRKKKLQEIFILMSEYIEIVVKAGVPYQDPPLELQIQYAINMGIGDILVRNGFLIVIGGGIIRLFLGLMLKKYRGK